MSRGCAVAIVYGSRAWNIVADLVGRRKRQLTEEGGRPGNDYSVGLTEGIHSHHVRSDSEDGNSEGWGAGVTASRDDSVDRGWE